MSVCIPAVCLAAITDAINSDRYIKDTKDSKTDTGQKSQLRKNSTIKNREEEQS